MQRHMTCNDYYNRGNDYLNQEKYDEAISDYNKALELDPKHVYAYNNRGLAYQAQGKYDKAMSDYNKALELDPKHVRTYNNRGNAYLKQEKLAKAILDYNKALALDPKYANADKNLKLLLSKRPPKKIFKSICLLPEKKQIKLLRQALNTNTLLGKKFHLNYVISCFIKNSIKDKVRAQYQSVIKDRVRINKAAVFITQGIRDKNSFFGGLGIFVEMPEEVGVLIASKIAENLSEKKSLAIANVNFEKYSKR